MFIYTYNFLLHFILQQCYRSTLARKRYDIDCLSKSRRISSPAAQPTLVVLYDTRCTTRDTLSRIFSNYDTLLSCMPRYKWQWHRLKYTLQTTQYHYMRFSANGKWEITQ